MVFLITDVQLIFHKHNNNKGVANAAPFFSNLNIGGTMARTIGLITEIEVINSVLSVAGDNPIQTLNEEYQPVFIIRQMLNNISRDMQIKNYWFNTEYCVDLESNTETDKIILPFNVLNFEPKDTKYVARGLTVYDREARTSTITETIVADISVMLEFDELPQVARKYIQSMCRQQYNNEYHGDTTLNAGLTEEVSNAKSDLDKAHIENEDINIFSNARSINIAFRNRRG
jgi:hypothetical protein